MLAIRVPALLHRIGSACSSSSSLAASLKFESAFSCGRLVVDDVITSTQARHDLSAALSRLWDGHVEALDPAFYIKIYIIGTRVVIYTVHVLLAYQKS